MIKKKSRYMSPAVMSIVCWLTFVWMRTFTYMTDYNERTGVYTFLTAAIVTMIATLFYWFILKPKEDTMLVSLLFDDETEDFLEKNDIQYGRSWSILRKSMFLLSSVAFLCLLAFVFEIWTDITVFTDTYINIGIGSINKKYMFDLILFIVFPLWTQTIFRGMSEEEYKIKCVLSGSFQLMLLSLISYLLFMKLPNIWLIELAIIEIIVVVNAIRKYVWKQCSGKKGNVIAMIGLYQLFWCSLLAVSYHSGQSFSQYTYGNEWSAYQEKVRQLIKGASAFGESSDLSSNHVILDFLTNKNNYFFSGVYYGGWLVAVVILAFLAIFLIATHRLLGIHAKFNRNYLVYNAAWWTLALRIVFGIPYSLGLFAMPINLPFAGKVGFYTDTIALGLLFWSVIEAKSIDKSFYKVRKVVDVFEKAEIKVEKQEPEDEFELYEVVQIRSGDSILICYAERYEEYKALVLEPANGDENWVLIVERDDETERWHDIENGSIRDEVLLKYIRNNRPDCMEVME